MLFSKHYLQRLLSHRDVRTSQGTFVSRDEDKEGVLAWIEDKIAQVTGLPVGHGEVSLQM